MLIIERKETDPYFNIAAEEYLLKNFSEDIFMLWQNSPSIILGKHQNAIAEINLDFIQRNNIPVIRRISGGGTVFHDMGNLNFTFIKNGEKEKLVDFQKFTDPIIAALKDLGLKVKFEGKNDLRINGLKISGNAEHVHKNRVLHHGTLLFSSELGRLNEAIKVDENKFTDKAVKSNRSTVTNIIDHLDKKINIDFFKKSILNYIKKTNTEAESYTLSDYHLTKIQNLADHKYKSWKWNFGYSPKYLFKKNVKSKVDELSIQLEVKEGIIKSASFKSLSFPKNELEDFAHYFEGISHEKEEIKKIVAQMNHHIVLKKFSSEFIINSMF